MPEAPAATPVLSTTSTSSPALARCHAVDRPWTPAPTTRCLTEAGREGGTELLRDGVAYHAMAVPLLCRSLPRGPPQCEPGIRPPRVPRLPKAGKRPIGIS